MKRISLEPADTLGQVFTPPELAELLSEVVLDGAGAEPLRILDPACGAGALLRALEPHLPAGSSQVGIELDPAILALAREGLEPARGALTLLQGDALRLLPGLGLSFDRVVSNPPYVGWTSIPPDLRGVLESGTFLGAPFPVRPHHADAQPDYSLAFLLLALHVLKPGGRLVFLLPPEWLVAPRLYALREHLNHVMVLKALVELPPRYPLFHARSGGRIETEALILVAERGVAPQTHVFPWVALEVGMTPAVLKGRWSGLLAGPEAWEKQALSTPEEPSPRSTLGPLIRTVRQQALEPDAWRAGPRVLPAGMQSLGAIRGLRVFGGHQPVVAWLEWLTLDEAERMALPARERRVLYPALQEARAFVWPVLPHSGRYWCIFPPTLSEAEVARRYPHLLACLRQKCERFQGEQGAEAVESAGIENVCKTVVLPEGWWKFPNLRNPSLLLHSEPQLLFPRTAPRLQASWDPFGHTFKGTNSGLRVEAAAGMDPEWLLKALFGYLNSAVGRALADPFLRRYHGLGYRLEPADIKRLPVPNPQRVGAEAAWARLAQAADRILGGEQDFGPVDHAARALVISVGALS